MSKRRMIKKTEAAEESNRMWIYIGAGVGAIVLIVLVALMVQSAVPQVAVVPTPTAVPDIPGLVQASTAPSRGHDDSLTLDYGELPPMGGTHNPIWQNCGIYVNPVRPENAIHTLEHGAVWVTYQPDLEESEVAALTDAVKSRSFILMSPFPNQRSKIVLTAWGVQLELDNAADARLLTFLNTFENGPQTPEPGAACTGGLSFTEG